MTGNAKSFYRLTARPTAEEFINDSLTIRRGRLAAIVLFHVADYWAIELGQTDKKGLAKIQNALCADCPDFTLIRDVANASKHDLLTWGTPKLSSSQQVYTDPGAVMGKAFSNHTYFNQPPMIIVRLNDQTSRTLVSVVSSVIEMWDAKFPEPTEGERPIL